MIITLILIGKLSGPNYNLLLKIWCTERTYLNLQTSKQSKIFSYCPFKVNCAGEGGAGAAVPGGQHALCSPGDHPAGSLLSQIRVQFYLHTI